MKWAYIFAFSILIFAPGTSYAYNGIVSPPLSEYYDDDLNVYFTASCEDGDTTIFVKAPNTNNVNNSDDVQVESCSAPQTDVLYEVQNQTYFYGYGTYRVEIYDANVGGLLSVNYFGMLPGVRPTNAIWGNAGLFGTSTNVASVVASGVTATGVSMWPLLIFLGVAVAFALAIKMQDFVMGSVDVNKPISPTGRNGRRTGSYKAFKKGKSELPGLWDK